MKIRVLALQYKINYLKTAANLLKFERLIKKYRFLKPNLVIFPEYALTGPLYAHYDLSFKENDPIFDRLSKLAKKYKVNLIPGSFVKKINNHRFNSSCFINSNGKILGYYNKQNLWSTENKFLKSGVESNIFKTNIGKIAIQICADLNSPLISARYEKLKPDLIVNLALWSEEDKKAETKKTITTIEHTQTELLVRARALENKAFMIFCNHAGQFNIKARTKRAYPETSIGNTMIVNPYGQIIARASGNSQQHVFSEINLSKCHWAKY